MLARSRATSATASIGRSAGSAPMTSRARSKASSRLPNIDLAPKRSSNRASIESDQRLGMHARKQERRPLSMALFVELFYACRPEASIAGTRRIRSTNTRGGRSSAQRVLQSIGNAEEKRSIDFVDLNTWRDCAVGDSVKILEFAEFFVRVAKLASDRANVRHLGHAFMNSIDANTMPTPTATVKSANTVRPKVVSNTAISLRAHGVCSEMVDFGHVPRNDHEHGRQRRQRNAAGERRRRHHDHQQGDGVNHAGNGCLAAALDVGGRSRIAPVAGMPPKRMEPMLATPWATSSQSAL